MAIKRRRHRGVVAAATAMVRIIRSVRPWFGWARCYSFAGRTMARSWRSRFTFPRLIRKSATDHQTAMARPPTTRNMTPRLTNGARRHQRSRLTGARATVPAPAKIDNKRTCGGLFRMVNCMASVFRRTGPVASTIMAGSVARLGHAVDPQGLASDRVCDDFQRGYT